jgi:hypothetical protein
MADQTSLVILNTAKKSTVTIATPKSSVRLKSSRGPFMRFTKKVIFSEMKELRV